MEKMIMGSIFLPMLFMQRFMAALAMSQPNFTADQFALLEFKAHITSDPLNIMSSNWTSATSICNWVGVSCGALHRRVTTLDLPNMNLTGSLPPQLGNLSFLVDLNLSGNNFHGHLPLEFGKLQRLRVMDLGNNFLYGSILDDIWLLSKLEIFKVGSNNQRTGTISRNIGEIPQEIGNLHNLEEVAAGNASLSGPILSNIFNISSLRWIYLYTNSLSGTLPIDLCYHLPNLELLSLYENQLQSSIPSSIGRCKKLQNLLLGTNKFTGYIPRSIGNLTELSRINLRENNLEGETPEEIGNLPLRFLNMRYNFLNGSIPPMIFNISTLEVIILGRNNLSGHLPSTIGLWLPKLTALKLYQNKLSGNFPNSLSNSSLLTILSLNENLFYGPFPNSLGHLRFLERLRLRNNMFHEYSTLERSFLSSLLSCNLPSTIGDLKDLTYLSLAENALEGNIPQSFDGLVSLEFLDLSNNILSGVIPKSLEGLSYLKFFNVSFNRLEGEIPCRGSFRNFFAQSFIRNTALCDLPRFQVPPWSFGSVYNGALLGGMSVAIKVFNMQVKGVLQSFNTECEVLRSCCHRNLVKIISTCCNEDFKALVLEFMPNGALEKWLYSDTCCLNILQRLDIVIDVAFALEYLHHGQSVSIIHCDLKPSNVLLDEDMVAHVGDFGLAKLLGKGASVMQTMQIATIGYRLHFL
ncbi:hypothetical protein SLEP1_g43347 [Rubroshorea leprosula]|uniref:non-specific serine/threonine protein kinase n=1 Tax=Rubroshorea leprosula TaxID=152421 RepID=A0AAV5LD01_9ROSI|nr:hypothetical protein SLEP1_g43347 [Rubroshorea leprosula]